MSTRVELRGLTKSYDGAAVVRGVDLVVEPGSLTALLGPSGCGKTTTLRVVAGLLDADGGDVLFDGAGVLGLPAEKRPVAMVFQKPLLFPHLSVGENVGFGLRMRKVPKRERAERVGRALELVRLQDLADRRVGEMSGGQEQRVALARALVTEPDVLLLDEPFSALDAGLRVEVRDLVRALQQELGVTTLFVTHDQEEAVSLADSVALMLDGRLEQHDVPRAFYDRPASLAVARFFGGRNEVPGQVWGGEVTSVLGTWPCALPDGPGVVVVRPEAVRLGHDGVAADVVASHYLGTHVSLTVALADGTRLHLSAPPSSDVPTSVRLDVRPQDCTVLTP
ncbi:MAG: ABC-type spermidine/putrescine transport system ATPase component [Frankiales bacterium]|nr:ABC-type spermidine/putrescine transport system ATPase component [Frankiales bacterium]